MNHDLSTAPANVRCELCGFGIAPGSTTALTSAGHAHPVCAMEALPVLHCCTCRGDRPHRDIPKVGMLCDACGTRR